MRDHQHRAAVRVQEFLQPFQRFDIQVVGRLIQQQDRRLGDQQAGQPYPRSLPAGKVVHLVALGDILQPQPFQDRIDLASRPCTRPALQTG